MGHALTAPRTQSFSEAPSWGPTLVTTLPQSSPCPLPPPQHITHCRPLPTAVTPLRLHSSSLQPRVLGSCFPRPSRLRWGGARSPDSLHSPAPGRVVLPGDLGASSGPGHPARSSAPQWVATIPSPRRSEAQPWGEDLPSLSSFCILFRHKKFSFRPDSSSRV